jgi:hypothetical protein
MGFAERIRVPPFNMVSASEHMIAWLSGTLVLAPPLDVSYCIGPPLRPLASGSQPQSSTAVVNLEPTLKDVKVGRTPCKRADPYADVSDWAKTVYSMAVELQTLHDMPWDEALQVADNSWADGMAGVPVADEPLPFDAEDGRALSESGSSEAREVIGPDDVYDVIGA